MSNVFVSHRGADTTQARRLAEDLRQASHNVWFDEWVIDIGDSIVQRMDEGLSGAAYLILCCSGAGVMSPWMTREWMSALARQLQGHDVRILPVMLTGDEIPAILTDIRAADLRTDWNDGMTRLLKSIK